MATFLAVRGTAASVLDTVTVAAIALLFFLHGAKLSPRAVVVETTALPLQLSMLASTFVLFPVLALHPFSAGWLPPALATGVLFLATLPSTVQSSIALMALARGDVDVDVDASVGHGRTRGHALLAGGAVGSLVLPLMLYHQLQLMVCAVLAQRNRAAAEREDAGPSTPSNGA